MKARNAPGVATWLLDQFGSDGRHDALAGDLIEQYQSGRSRLWYWRQVVASITIDVASDTRDHPFLALRAVLTGWVALLFFSLLAGSMPASGTISAIGVSPWTLMGLVAPPWLTRFWESHHWTAMSYLIAQCVVAAGSGWVVMRAMRPRHAAMLMVYLLTFVLLTLPEGCRLASNAAAHERFTPYLWGFVQSVSFSIASIVIGGSLGARRKI